MYELSRIRLYSIGPAGARYADTVLDLRGVGGEVPRPAPAQGDFFAAEPAGPPRRPAPAGVLFLENGGGKSVLLKLIFSVMLPGHRNTLGGASSGVLRKFLLADDTGHVALEWQHTVTGEQIVVGKVSEWRGRQVSGDPRKFAEAWYSFRPGPGMGLDALPVAEMSAAAVRPAVEGASGARGRRRTMKGFRDALTEAGKAYPHLDVAWEEIHERWNEHLTRLGLDPELFRYQREMNADEGEAAGLFAVKNDSDFTHLLLRAVTDTRDTDGLADLVHGFAHKLGRRAELTAERDFTAGSLDLLAHLVTGAEQRTRARDVLGGAERRARALAARLTARAGAERARAAELARQERTAAERATAAESSLGHSELIAAELAYRHASLALAAAEKSAAGKRRELTDARTLHAAWQAAEAVLRHRAAADRAARVSVAIREAERDAAPALAARAAAATGLVRALHAAARDGEALAAEQEERSAVLQQESETAHADAVAAATRAQRARSETDHLRQRLTEVEQETAEAVRAGWLDAADDAAPDTALDKDPARAALVAGDAEKAAVAAWDEARESARTATDRARETAEALARAELAAARARDAAEASAAAHDTARGAAESLAAEPRLAELLGLPEPDGEHRALSAVEFDRSADELRALLDARVTDDERRLFDLRTAAADDARILAALGDGGLLPPGPDVLAVVACLGEHGIPALPGWRYLAQAVDPADHAAVLDARPELVDGVVITDPDTHARARDVLREAALLPRSALAVGTAAALLAPPPPTGERDGGVFLVPPNPAMHDERAADDERHALRARAADRDEQIRAFAARLAADRALAARLASWRAGCPAGRLAELAAAAGSARTAAAAADETLTRARADAEDAAAAAEESTRAREDRQEQAQRARRSADALAGLAHRLRERAGWQARLRELADEALEYEARAADCVARARAADEDRRAAQRAADDARRTSRALRAERAEIAGVAEELEAEAADEAAAAEAAGASSAVADGGAGTGGEPDGRTVSGPAGAGVDAAAPAAAGPASAGGGAGGGSAGRTGSGRAHAAASGSAGADGAVPQAAGPALADAGATADAVTPDATGTAPAARPEGARPEGNARRRARLARAAAADAARASLPALREAYRAASQVYEKVGVGADLRAEQARAESEESAALAELNRLSNKVRTRAATLLAGPDGADAPSRQAAAARAESVVHLLESRSAAASETLGRLRGDAERLAPAGGDAHTELPEDLVPDGAEHAQALLRSAAATAAERADDLAAATAAHAELRRACAAAEDAAGAFAETAAMLRDLLRGPAAGDEQDDADEAEPFPGGLEGARQAAAESRRSLRGCAADLATAESALRDACDVLVRHANSTRYEQVRTPARQQIRELPAAALPEHAAAWAAAFAPRLRVLTDELAQLERNRDGIVDRLRGLVESGLATLRAAQRLSRLPEGLGEWSGQEFLRIRFEDPDQATLSERLGEVIDEATRAAVRKNSDLRRDGTTLLLRGVDAAMEPKGVSVEILKPDAVLRAERVPVGQMGDVFSGGQLLTAAIALYCTMAALRGNDRGDDRHHHAGTLFLDNPIGRANATYLLELQRAVADALGVQLLYTTGLFDTTALAEFPLVIRLRNDADLRAGLKYITVEEHLRPGLPAQREGVEPSVGEVTATRIFRRPPATAP
ncbi:hypothetical protein O7599_35635 [Streptomyces sp. WMMC500]|uniref:hypothetical protein n=1 Tax=Streptomyces sp. WMMC500 TaxID=3015154 RepID=UPI00248B99B0|nr:hypothetical protein [Streptomyces sp. WMMC500]WBB60768.1 hypothetical protein O7599_35635 [Streptomyces sp. WMMC500]